ncbi:MAG: ATP-binding cassette domain-containing protein [Chitinophagales bacterium]|nr:ATP-binding cassette domain-containing protein [Chitinophagales bacterium]
MENAITVTGLSKKYQLGRKRSGSFRETMSERFSGLFTKESNEAGLAAEFWALKEVSFEVKPGEVVGIIGKNGAGKSTLLKILSRITAPTKGRVEITGRVSSLLEVGTGFHPELTGRENIYMNGAILGMKRNEIKSKFDEIVAFSGIGQFIDTPVKRYSSGMYVRLAFAVAAHLEPEILIIDEVLAVGDAEFQKKCLGKMKDVSEQEGRTVLFVSHNMDTIEILCTNGILLHNGEIFEMGKIHSVVEKYTDYVAATKEYTVGETPGIFNLKNRNNKLEPKSGIQQIKTYCDGELSDTMYSGCNFKFEVYIENYSLSRNVVLGFVIKDEHNRPLLAINNKHLSIELNNFGHSNFVLTFGIAQFLLSGQERFIVDLYLGDGICDIEVVQNAFHINMKVTNFYNGAVLPEYDKNRIIMPGIFAELTNTK